MKFYTEYITNDLTMANVLFAYCEGKSFLWNMFFGWKNTKIIRKEEIYRFIIPTKKIKELEKIAYSLDKSN